MVRMVAIHSPTRADRPETRVSHSVPAAQRGFGLKYTAWKPYPSSATVRAMNTHLYGARASSVLTQAPATPILNSANGNKQHAAHTPSDASMPPAADHLTIRLAR